MSTRWDFFLRCQTPPTTHRLKRPTKIDGRPRAICNGLLLVSRRSCGSLFCLPLWSRSSRTRLSLRLGYVNHGALLQLTAAQVAFGYEVEVGRLTLGAALTCLDAASVNLGRPIRGQVELDVHGALRTEGLLFHNFLLVGITHDVELAIRHLLHAESKFVERVLTIVINTPRLLGILLEGTLAPILDDSALLDRRYVDRCRATAAQVGPCVCRRCRNRNGAACIRVGCRHGSGGAAAAQLATGGRPAIGHRPALRVAGGHGNGRRLADGNGARIGRAAHHWRLRLLDAEVRCARGRVVLLLLGICDSGDG